MAENVCPLCGGAGWILEESKDRSLAKRCKCFQERKNQLLLEEANIPSRYQHCTINNFNTLLNESGRVNDSLRDAKKISKKFVNDYPILNCGLLFLGPCGVGKTHLAVAIIHELIEKKSVPCYFCDFRELIRNIQSSYTPDSSLTESELLEPVFEREVLVLDELGAKRTTAWVEETVFYIINNRYNNKKLTIFTSNYLDIEEENGEKDTRLDYYKKGGKKYGGIYDEKEEDSLVKRIGVRLRSRIYEMCMIVNIMADDYRKKIKQAGYRF
jgi:DNA replication protein DnaC